MQNLVILIAKPEIDWINYLSLAKQALGHSVSTGIDSANISADTIPAFLSTLNELFNGDSSLRDVGCLIDHLSFSFLIISDTNTPFYLLQNSNLRIHIKDTLVSGYSLSYVTGSLMDWRETIINLSTGNEPHNIRLIVDKILIILEQEGFRELFFNYRKQKLPDQTFKLIEKK